MSAARDFLQKIFSQKVIIKRMPNNRLRTIDYNKAQAIGGEVTGRYKRAFNGRNYGERSFAGSGYGYSNDTQLNQINAARRIMYQDYELMDTDSIISAALDIYADEATVRNEQGDMLTINTDDEHIKQILYNLYYDILNIEFNLWHWTRSLCKFGDLFLYLELMNGIGVLDAIPIQSALVDRDDNSGKDGNETHFIYEGESNRNFDKNLFGFHEMAHFRLLADTNFLPYGKSMLEGGRKEFKRLSMMEDAMLIQRIMRAPERRVFKIDVGNIPPESIEQHMNDVSAEMKKIPYIDENTGEYNLKFNLQNMLEDYYLPVRGSESGTEIDTLDGLSNEGAIDDIKYIQAKQFGFLKIPKAYLGYDEGLDGKGTLAAEDIRFARLIERIQKIITSELEKIGHIHLYMQGFSKEDLINFKLSLATPSLIYERQKVDLLNEKVNLIGNLKEHRIFSDKRIYEKLFNLTPEEWKAEQSQIVEDAKRKFRLDQIEEEGNDPVVSGKTYGTPHDISFMQVSSKLTDSPSQDAKSISVGAPVQLPAENPDDGRHENEGRPEKEGSFERAKDPTGGVDPTGRKELKMGQNNDRKNLLAKLQQVTQKQLMPLNELMPAEDEESNINMLNESSLLDEETV